MFLDLRDDWPPVPPPQPPVSQPAPPLLDKRGERIVGVIVAINLALLLLAPIAGATVVQALKVAIKALGH